MKRLNEIWVPKSKAERVIVVIATWVICSIIFGLTGENELVAVFLGVIAVVVTVYTLTQASEELKEADQIQKKVKQEQAILNQKANKIAGDKKKEMIYNEMIKQKSIKKGVHPETGELCCPKCGSTSLSGNRKGKTLFTGVIGSKNVYVTCMNCGKRWRAGRI